MTTWGFVVLRHVCSPTTNLYWQECVRLLRRYYGPRVPIVIVDDTSDPAWVTSSYEDKHLQVYTVPPELSRRGEFLPYYLLWKHHWFDTAVILHDSVFVQQHIVWPTVRTCLPLWHFAPDLENQRRVHALLGPQRMRLIHGRAQTNAPTVMAMKKHTPTYRWYGCFGGQSIVTHTFLTYLETKYNWTNWKQDIQTRSDRCCFERLWGLLLAEENKDNHPPSLFGLIHSYQRWGYSWELYRRGLRPSVPVSKVWSGR